MPSAMRSRRTSPRRPTPELRQSTVGPDWELLYAYNRWRPTLFVTASSVTSLRVGTRTEDGPPASASLRERQFEVGALFPVRHVRTSQTTFLSFRRGVPG